MFFRPHRGEITHSAPISDVHNRELEFHTERAEVVVIQVDISGYPSYENQTGVSTQTPSRFEYEPPR